MKPETLSDRAFEFRQSMKHYSDTKGKQCSISLPDAVSKAFSGIAPTLPDESLTSGGKDVAARAHDGINFFTKIETAAASHGFQLAGFGSTPPRTRSM